MSLKSTKANISAFAYGLGAAVSNIIDTFTRTNGAGLGTSDSGNAWSIIRGAWTVNGSAATSATAASSYPVAVIPFKQDVTLEVLSTLGNGVVFWQTGANDWWASIPYEYINSEGYTCNTCQSNSCCTGSPNQCVNNNCCTGIDTCVPNSCCSTNSGNICYAKDVSSYQATDPCGVSFTVPAGTGCYYHSHSCCVASNCCTGSNTCVANSCCTTINTCVSNSCCTGSSSATCYRNRYYWGVRILKMVSNAVTELLNTDLSNSLTDSNPIVGIRVIVSGNLITVRAYSNTNFSTQVGSDVTHTASSPNKGSGIGIVKAPSSANQGTTIDNFVAT